MTRAQTMDVINDSTTIQSRIDAVLADPTLQWDYSPDIQWQPGDPLWPHPSERRSEEINFSSPVLQQPHGWAYSMSERGGGNHVRPMFEIIGLDDYFGGYDDEGDVVLETWFSPDDTMDGSMYLVDCDDCLVGIGDDEVNCWNCGRRVRMESKNDEAAECRRQAAESIRADWGEWGEWLNRMSPERYYSPQDDRLIIVGTTFDDTSSLRGVRSLDYVLDEAASWATWSTPIDDADLIEYSSWDAAFTQQAMSYIWNSDTRQTREPGTNLYWDVPRRQWPQLRISDEFMTTQEPTAPEIARISLQETRPDLYRPGYKRYFESENSHARTPSAQRVRRPGRSGGTRLG